MTELTVLTLDGKPLQLVAGDPAYCAKEAHRRIVEHYCRQRGLPRPLDVENFKTPYYRSAGGYQAIGGYRPSSEGEPWQLADGRKVIISGVTAGERVRAQVVKPWGSNGGPGFYPVELAIADLDGATAWA